MLRRGVKSLPRFFFKPSLIKRYIFSIHDPSISPALRDLLAKIRFCEWGGTEKKKSAQQIVEQVLQDSPNVPAVLYVTGLYYQGNGFYPKAIALLEKLNASSPTAEIFTRLGNLYHIQRQFEKAEESYKQAITIEPHSTIVHFGLAVLLAQQNRNEEAQKHFQFANQHHLSTSQEYSTFAVSRMRGTYLDFLRQVENDEKMITNNDHKITVLVTDKKEEYEAIKDDLDTGITMPSITPAGTGPYFIVNKKKPGDIVMKEEPLVLVESDKMSVDFETIEAGVVLSITDADEVDVEENFANVLPFKARPITDTMQITLPETLYSGVDQVAQKLKDCKNIVVLTGSGISVANPSSLKTRKDLWSKLSREDYVSIWRHAEQPNMIWQLIQQFLADADFSPQPNEAHYALANLEQMGVLKGVITQNVDSLHQMAGNTNVIELHGTLNQSKCTYCQVECGPCIDHLESEQYPPVCPCFKDKTKCFNFSDKPGHLRPDVVLFGELVDPYKLQKAVQLVMNCDALLVIGTAMDVAPASELPVLAAEKGAIVVEMKRNPSRLCHRGVVKYFVQGEAAATLPELVSKMTAK
jgi:NAD-dependent deacetylase